MDLTTAFVIVAVVGYVLVRRFLGEPLEARRLVLVPAGLVAYGGYVVSQTDFAHPADLVALTVGGLVAVGGGVARGLTVRVFVRDGHLWYRYTWLTVAVWGGLVALRVAQSVAAGALGADRAVLTAALLLTAGLSFLGESAVVGLRATSTGVPFAPRRVR